MNDEKDPVATLVRLAGRRPAVDAERTARVRATVQNEWGATMRRRRLLRVGVAAAVAATIAGTIFLLPIRETTEVTPAPIVARVQHGSGAGRALRAGAELALGENETASLEWNGATLRLDRGTRLRLDASDVATLHYGAVYYADDSHPGPTGSQPVADGHRRAESPSLQGITLHTPFGDIRDVGTRFEVRVTEDAVRVRVRDGAVLVRDTTAGAGMEIVATRTSIVERKIATSGDAWSWIETAAPPIVFEGQTLDAVLRRIALEKGLTLDWNGSDQTLHGDVPLSAGEALDAATAAAGVTYRIEGDRLIVRGRP